MHQSGQLRAHSMQTVQFSSLSAMTPRARVGGASLTLGYWVVTAGRVIVLNVTPSPLSSPGTEGISAPSSERHLEDRRRHDVDQGEGDQELPRERLQLILPEPRVREADPEDEEG